jgi:hypothetical protein
MKVIGIMCVRDEADLLPEVLEHLDGELDALYAYDDGSIDNTLNILWQSPVVNYIMTRKKDVDRLVIKRPHYHHLLEKIKKDYLNCDEPVWVVITMGDRFFLNKKPRQIAEEAEAGGFTAVNGAQLDFLRHQSDPWTEENDTFPKYPDSLRNLCKWFKWDENCIVAFKLTGGCSYMKARYPWPKGCGDNVQYKMGDSDKEKLSPEMPFLEHQGRRSPKAFAWRVQSGSRKLSRKIKLETFTFDDIMEVLGKMYKSWKVLPWVDNSSLTTFLEMFNNPDWIYNAFKRSYFEPVMEDIETNGPHERKDI